MKTIHGDLIQFAFDGRFDVIVHGCNCFCRMKRGIAKQIAEQFPFAVEADNETSSGDRTKLGSFSSSFHLNVRHSFWIVNAYTQFDWKGPQPRVSYDAVERSFLAIVEKFSGSRIGYPKIGAGLAGGDWGVISKIIDRTLEGEDHTLVEFVASDSAQS